MTPSWLATLDAFDSHLGLQSELIRDGRYDELVVFAPPAGLPTLPEVMVSRALMLLDRAQGLTERAQRLIDQADAMRNDPVYRLARSRHLAFAHTPDPVYVNQQV